MPGTSTDATVPRGSSGLPEPTRTLVDDYLAEQQRLQTPVRRLSEAHDRGQRPEGRWSELLPLSRPSPGEQYAFEVDLDRCSGCKACVAGCHSLNGLDEDETWRDVGLLIGGTRSQPYLQTITTACHHCADPACLNGCPVLAYEKDPATGIVRHLDDQCIGCQYCVLKCPYDVPKYSSRLGIVRKCDLCHGRLSAGEPPACAQACPTQAIRIVTVRNRDDAGAAWADTRQFLAQAPSPDYTRPTTRYVGRRPVPAGATAADAAALRVQPAHPPLVAMLTLLPLAVGCSILAAPMSGDPRVALTAAAAGAAGLAASVLHLGQPLRAWRVFLGLRRSWLSREAVLFGLWLPVAAAFAALRWKPALFAAFTPAAVPLGWTSAALGAAGLACSVMIYADTRRWHWRGAATAARFFGTAALLGCAAQFAWGGSTHAALTAAGLALAKAALEMRTVRVLDGDDESPSPARLTALLLTGPLRRLFSLRLLCALGVVAAATGAIANVDTDAPRWLLPAFALAGEALERLLFFRAVDAPKMPGGPRA